MSPNCLAKNGNVPCDCGQALWRMCRGKNELLSKHEFDQEFSILTSKKRKESWTFKFLFVLKKRAFFLKSVACISFIFSVNASGNRIFICVQFNVHWCIKKKPDQAIYFSSTTSSWSWFMTSEFGFNDQNDPEEILQSYISIIRKQIINVILCT